jgi:hypothetical protein
VSSGGEQALFMIFNYILVKHMLEDFMVEYENAIGFLLDKGIDVLVYAGDADFIW